MVQVFGSVESTVLMDDVLITEFRIPAISKTLARQRARTNARLKGLDTPEITGIEELREGDLPGQTIYIVSVESLR